MPLMREMKTVFKWENFRSFKDTNWITIKPLTIFIGPNASGKTSLIQPLLLLTQTYKSADKTIPLKTSGRYIKAGTYKDLIHNHKLNDNITFTLKFYTKIHGEKLEKKKPIGKNPPLIVSFAFAHKDKITIQLKSYTVKDSAGRILIKRDLKKSRYSLSFCKTLSKNKAKDKRIYASILKQMPMQFIFDAKPIIEKDIEARGTRNKKLSFTYAQTLYISVLTWMEALLNDLLYSIKYIGPLRESPKRYYEFDGEHHSEVGSRGQYTFSVLYHLNNTAKEKQLNYWLDYFNLAKKIDSKLISSNLLQVLADTNKKNFEVNIADTGFGVSQLLPLIVQTIISKEDDLIITEQPEIHLNPKLESRLADFFVKMVNDKRRFIVETHSEHLILRLRTLIKKGEINPNDVAIYFVENNNNESKARLIEIDKNGEFPGNNWPKGFFEESLSEALRFATLKRR